MSTVLFIQASPRGDLSYSSKVAESFLDAYREIHPGDEVKRLNVFDTDLPPFDGLAVKAKYSILHGVEHTSEELEAWKAVEAVVAEFTSVDKYVMAVPMWNFGIPYRLKHYIDLIVQPGYTFSFSPEKGYAGLVTGKPLLIILSRGGDYGEETEHASLDMQNPYLELIMGFMGFTDIRSIVIQPTMAGGKEVAEEKLSEAIGKARDMAEKF